MIKLYVIIIYAILWKSCIKLCNWFVCTLFPGIYKLNKNVRKKIIHYWLSLKINACNSSGDHFEFGFVKKTPKVKVVP